MERGAGGSAKGRERDSASLAVNSSKERARLSGVQLSTFSLSFDFFVSSSARVPVNVYDNLPVITELPKGTVISCLTSYGAEPEYFVHVGTTEGAVLLFRVTKRKTQSNTDCFESVMDKKRILGKQKKESILQLEVLADGGRVVALTSAGAVQVMSATTLDIEETIATKGRVDRIVTEKLSPLMGIACVQKRLVQIFQYRGGEYKLEKELTLKDTPEDVEWTKGKLFIGYKNKYSFLYVDAEAIEETDIEGLEPGAPQVVQAGDVMLMRTGRQGVFTTFSGKKTGKKLDWSAPPINVGYRKPYALSLQKEQLEIHNCSDEQMVQLIKNTQQMERLADGALLLGASPSLVFCLHARTWDSQIGQLIKAQRVDEAINLFKTSIPASTPTNEKDRIMREIQKAAGIVLFSNLKFSAAIPYLKESDFDLREIVSLFPGYLPSSLNYKPRHQLESLEYLITETLLKRTRTHSAPTDRVKQYERSASEGVLELLLHRRKVEGECKAKRGSDPYVTRRIMDTAIVKLLVDLGSDQLAAFLASPIPVIVDEDDVLRYLTEHQQMHGLAVFYRMRGDEVKALDLWRELGKEAFAAASANAVSAQEPTADDGEEGQVAAPPPRPDGIRDTVDLLSRSNDVKLVFKYSAWVLERNIELGTSIFTSTLRKDPLPVDEVFAYLSSIRKVGSQIASKYLEYVVFHQKNSDEKYHTKLANSYLDVILPLLPESYDKDQARPEPGTEPGLLGPYRLLLFRLMEFSKVLNASSLLLRIKDTVLYEEQILCYTRLGQHEDALRVIFTNLKSHNKAAAYCQKHQATADVNLFLILLKVYLKRVRNGELSPKVEQLLNDYPQYLRPNEVIPLLPPTINIKQLEKYFERSLRQGQSQLRSRQVEKQLRKKDLMDAQLQRNRLTARAVVVQPNTKCKVCKGNIGETMMVYYPNGVVCHFKCKKSDFICPVSGRNFKTNPMDP